MTRIGGNDYLYKSDCPTTVLRRSLDLAILCVKTMYFLLKVDVEKLLWIEDVKKLDELFTE